MVSPPIYTDRLHHVNASHPEGAYGSPHNRLLSTSRDQGCSNTVYGYSTITITRSQDLEAQRNIGFDSDCDSESLSMTLVKVFLFLVFTPLILVCLVLYGSYNLFKWIYDSTGIFFWVAVIAFFIFFVSSHS